MKTKTQELPIENCSGLEFIHYGCKHFNPKKFEPIINFCFTKPSGGFWASPVRAEWGWSDWCKSENFYVNKLARSFTFKLSENARVYRIKCCEDLERLPLLRKYEGGCSYCSPDYEEMLKMGIDAVLVEISNDHRLYWALYGWDCDSILIMNPDIVEEVRK